MNLSYKTYLIIYIIAAIIIYIYVTWKWDKKKKLEQESKDMKDRVNKILSNHQPNKLSSNDIQNEFEKEENPFSFNHEPSDDLTQYELEDDLYTKKVYDEIEEQDQENDDQKSSNFPDVEIEIGKDSKKSSAEDEFKNLDNLDFIKKISKGLNKN